MAGNPLRKIDRYGLIEDLFPEDGENPFGDDEIDLPYIPGPFGTVCGSGLSATNIPDGIYKKACGKHDKCYSKCGKSKFDCDAELASNGAPIYSLILLFSTQAQEAYDNAQKIACREKGGCN